MSPGLKTMVSDPDPGVLVGSVLFRRLDPDLDPGSDTLLRNLKKVFRMIGACLTTKKHYDITTLPQGVFRPIVPQ